MTPPVCPYCSTPAVIVGGEAIYPLRPDLFNDNFWLCRPCWAYVGCHHGTGKPLGRLANEGLRRAKRLAHAAFDPLWKENYMGRSSAYKWLAEQLAIPADQAHIGMFDVSQCEEVVRVCEAYYLGDAK